MSRKPFQAGQIVRFRAAHRTKNGVAWPLVVVSEVSGRVITSCVATAVRLPAAASDLEPMPVPRMRMGHYCSRYADAAAGLQHTTGTGRAKRPLCAWCGGDMVTEVGVWGVFAWEADGVYAVERSVRTYARQTDAESFIQEHPAQGLVARWVTT